VPLRWEKRDDRTAVWTLWYGQATEARRVDAGLKTEAIVTGLTNGLWWFAVAGEDSEGVIVETSRVLQLKFPPVRILNICQRIDGKEKILVSYTNTPPGKVGLFYTRQQEDHTP
jgi:hypothetical protein